MKKEEISKFYINYKLYIFPIIITLSSLVLIIFVIYPQTIKLISNQKVKTEIANKSKFLEAKAQTLDSLDPQDLSRKVNFTLGFYPTDKDFVTVFGLLQNLISQSGFVAISLSLDSNSLKSANGSSYSLRLEVLGPSPLLPILLNKLESSPRLIRLAGLEASKGKNAQEVNISLTVDVLYAAAPTSFGSVDSPIAELTQRDEEIIAKLAKNSSLFLQPELSTRLNPKGKVNPFE